MKKLFFITIILLLQSFPSFGEWVEVNKDKRTTSYIEEDSLMKRGDLIYVNILVNHITPHYGRLSSFHRTVINCKESTFKSIKSIYYKRSMGRGEIIQETTFPSIYEFIDLYKYPNSYPTLKIIQKRKCKE